MMITMVVSKVLGSKMLFILHFNLTYIFYILIVNIYCFHNKKNKPVCFNRKTAIVGVDITDFDYFSKVLSFKISWVTFPWSSINYFKISFTLPLWKT